MLFTVQRKSHYHKVTTSATRTKNYKKNQTYGFNELLFVTYLQILVYKTRVFYSILIMILPIPFLWGDHSVTHVHVIQV